MPSHARQHAEAPGSVRRHRERGEAVGKSLYCGLWFPWEGGRVNGIGEFESLEQFLGIRGCPLVSGMWPWGD